jgi:uncharacterized membrane protein
MSDGETLRVIACLVTFSGILNSSFHQIRQNGQGNVSMIHRLLEGFNLIGEYVEREGDRQSICVHIDMLQRDSRKSLNEMNDIENIEDRCRQVFAVLNREEQKPIVGQERTFSIPV